MAPLRTNLSEWSKTPFESQAHLIESMRDPAYKRVPEYRAAVEAKLCLDTRGISTTLHTPPDFQTSDSGIGQADTTAGQERIAAEKSAEDAHREAYGALSVAPKARGRTQELSTGEASQWNRGDHLPRTTEYPDQ